MINILIVSNDELRSKQVEQLIRQAALSSQTTTVRAHEWRAPAWREPLQRADAVIVLPGPPQPEAYAELAKLLESAAQAVGFLLTEEALSAADMSAAMRAGVRHVQSWPLDGDELVQALSLIEKKRMAQGGSDGRVLTFLSSRGGSGTTFAATQFAYACATRLGKKVLLIDADRQYADAQLFLASDFPATTLADMAGQAEGLDAALFDAGVARLHPKLDLLPGAGDPVKAAQIRPEQLTRILQFARARYDVVIVDAGRHIDASVVSLLDHSNALFLLMRQSVPDLYSAKRVVDILQDLGYPASKMHTIVNQYDSAAKLDTGLVRNTLQIGLFHTYPSDRGAAQQVTDQGTPLAVVAPRSRLARAVEASALQYFEAGPAAAGNWWSRLVAGSLRQPAPAPARELKID